MLTNSLQYQRLHRVWELGQLLSGVICSYYQSIKEEEEDPTKLVVKPISFSISTKEWSCSGTLSFFQNTPEYPGVCAINIGEQL